MTCVFLFRKSVAERKQKAESVIKKKEKWFLNVIQVAPPVTQGTTGHIHLLPRQRWPSLFAMPTTWPAFLSGPLWRSGWSNSNQAQFLDISLSAMSTSIWALERNGHSPNAESTLTEQEEMTTSSLPGGTSQCPGELSTQTHAADR